MRNLQPQRRLKSATFFPLAQMVPQSFPLQSRVLNKKTTSYSLGRAFQLPILICFQSNRQFSISHSILFLKISKILQNIIIALFILYLLSLPTKLVLFFKGLALIIQSSTTLPPFFFFFPPPPFTFFFLSFFRLPPPTPSVFEPFPPPPPLPRTLWKPLG